jgi:secreted trypsin-like serine protease
VRATAFEIRERVATITSAAWAIRRLATVIAVVALLLLTADALANAASGVPLVVGGTPASANTWPWLAFIYDEQGSTVSLCTGTVVAPDVVLTAAHCVENPVNGVRSAVSGFHVITGAVNWRSPARQQSTVSQIIVHPLRAARGVSNNVVGDAALLVLRTPTTAPAVALADSAEASLVRAGTRAEFAGWGRTDPKVARPPNVLRWASTVIQRPAYCAHFDSSFDARAQLCALDAPVEANSTCYGDSGGPLAVQDQSGSWFEVAVISTGGGNCSRRQADYYTRADYIHPWLESALRELSSGAAPPAAAVRYRGLTSQGRHAAVVLSAGRRRLTGFSVGLRLSCHHGYHDVLTGRWFSKRHPLVLGEDLGVTTTLRVRPSAAWSGGHFSLRLAISSARVTGTIGGVQHSRRKLIGGCVAEHVTFTLARG